MRVDKDSLFEDLLKQNKDRIYRICCYYVSGNEDRNDLYQEVLVKIWKNLESFRNESALSTWIFRITANTALTFLAQQKRRRKELYDYSDALLTKGSESASKNAQDEIDFLHEALSRLPLLDMIIMSLVLEETSAKEIAQVTGLTECNVRVRIHRAKKALRTLLEGE